MPPKQKITKDMILSAGYELARKEGIESVNSRNIAKKLSCSTQPIFSSFATMEELRKGVFDFACNKFVKEVTENKDDSNFLSLTTKWYLDLLRNEPNLYKLLYFSDGFDRGALSELISQFSSNHALIAKLHELYSLEEKSCSDILLRAFSILHGIGALVFFNSFEISDKDIMDTVKRTVFEMVRCAQEEMEKRQTGISSIKPATITTPG